MAHAPGPGAAEVASQLLEFYREPARYRPAWIHGERELPPGHVVLKLALGRLSHGWQRDLARDDREEIVQAARAFVRQVCLRDSSSHYQVLCASPDSSLEAIRENYRLLMALIHPDRQEGGDAVEWPQDCAQRVNEAYAVLADAARRAEYDAGVRRAHAEVELSPAFPVPRVRARRPSMMRTFSVVVAVAVALFALQAWWVNDTPQHYGLLERTSATQWVRDVLSDRMQQVGSEQPRMAFDPVEVLGPPRTPQRATAWIPSAAVQAVPAPVPDRPAIVAQPATVAPVVPMASAAPAAPPRVIMAQASPAPPAPAAPAKNAGPGSKEIELMVARLVSSYEQGDADALMSLFAPGEPGFFKSFRVRAAYADFFRATRDRRLRMNRLDWQTSSDVARARGEATVIADYTDGSGHLERTVPVELDIALRDGEARLTRLNLFPEPK